jgi:hypothetical protein
LIENWPTPVSQQTKGNHLARYPNQENHKLLNVIAGAHVQGKLDMLSINTGNSIDSAPS